MVGNIWGMDLEGLGWVRRAWDCCGMARVGIQGQGIVWGPRMSMGCVIWVSRALLGCGGPKMGVNDLRWTGIQGFGR